MRCYWYFLVLILVVLTSCGVNHDTKTSKRQYEAPLINEFSKHGTIGAYVVELGTGNVVLSKDENKRMTPASLTKLFTTGASLEILGEGYTFETKAYVLSEAEGGKHHLYIQGGGDPTLGSNRFPSTKIETFFEAIYQGIKKRGLNELNGDILIDQTYLVGPGYPSKRNWEDMANYYGAVPNALTYKENTFVLTLKSPSKIEAPCQVVTCLPDVKVSFICEVLASSNNKDSAYIYGVAGQEYWTVQGSIPAGREAFNIKGAVPYPGRVFGAELKTYLQNKGIRIDGTVKFSEKPVLSDAMNLVAMHQSPKLSDIIAVINKKSMNLFADHLLMDLGKVREKEGSWDSGCLALNRFWSENINDFSGTFYDGSGLSPFNACSCKDLVEILMYMHHSDQVEVFKQTLSIGGIDGTLRGIWKENGVKGAVIGKSGSMNGVLGYAGYFTAASGEQFAFCVMVNHFTESFDVVRTEIEDLVTDLVRNN